MDVCWIGLDEVRAIVSWRELGFYSAGPTGVANNGPKI